MGKLKWNAGQIVNDTNDYELAQFPTTKPKYLVDYDFKDMEIARLNKIIEEIDRIANTDYQTNIYTGSYSFKRGYNEGSKFFQEFLRNKLKELKEEGKE